MITFENFNKNNRSKTIGNSLYRICQDQYTQVWSIFEIFNDGDRYSSGHDYHSKNLADVIDKLMHKIRRRNYK